MPPSIAATAIGAGATGLGTYFNIREQRRAGRINRQFAREMYDKQHGQALDFWHRQNMYNTPGAQMTRLKKAGLNPHLVYGQSAGGATGQAGSIDTASPTQATETPGNFGPLMDNIGKAGQLALLGAQKENIQANTDNTRAQTQVFLQDEALKKAGVIGKGLQNTLAGATLQTNLAMARENLEKIKAEKRITINRDEREAIQTSSNVYEAATRILKMRAETAQTKAGRQEIYQRIRNLKKDEGLKRLEYEWMDRGVNKNDPQWQRKLIQWIDPTKKLIRKTADTMAGRGFSSWMYNKIFGN